VTKGDEKKEEFLSRWSRQKLDAEKPAPQEPATPAPVLPPVESLTPESDFKGFMDPRVKDALRRVALKKLFSDPHFKLPDLFEPYSGDWTVSEPIPEAMLASLEQMKHLLRQLPDEVPKAEKEASAEKKLQPDEPGRQDT